MQDVVRQSFYIVADNQRIYHIVNEDNTRFKVKKQIDFTKHEIFKEITNLRDIDWAHVFVSNKSLTFDGNTYNLDTYLVKEFTIPSSYFGEKLTSLNQTEVLQQLSDDEDSEDDEDEEDKDEW